MKITKVTPYPFFAGPKNLMLCRVDTDEGVYGWGEAYVVQGKEKAVQIYIEAMAPYMIGRSPFEIKHSATAMFDGFAIREGDYLALLEGKLFDTDTSIGAVLEKLAAEADSRGAEFVNLFYGSDVSEEDARKAGEQFGRLCPGAEINVVSGGQPVYYYIISME